MKCLEHESDGAAPKERTLIIAERGQIPAVQQYPAGVGLIETREEIQQRRLADPGFAHDGDISAGSELEIQLLEQRPAGPVALPEILEPQYGVLGQSCHRASGGVDADDGLDLQEVAQPEFTVLAPVAGHLEAAEGRLHVTRCTVQRDLTGANAGAHASGAF